VAVEHREHIVLFEDPGSIVSHGRRGQDIELIVDANDIVYGHLMFVFRHHERTPP
jgi:hypothetical protein